MASPHKRGPTQPDLTYLFTANITTTDSVAIGTTPFGDRGFIPITGGSFSGPNISGSVASGGADWGLTGSNGVFSPDVAYALETDDGANIFVRQHGRATNNLALFETGSADYAWFNAIAAYAEATKVDTGVVLEYWQVGTTAS